ncbi:MAG TPA: nucleotide pyrophosphatase/phosphodiesterase family protein [Candidatus Paceibacterota bacterium]|nr:nucleotide pyrophosphatase/phosphodiesterase family protein [Candidatus Paceibacterota bacterium]
MFRHDLLHEIKKERQQVSFVYPYYGRLSIAEIPPTIQHLFGIATERPVLPFAADWNHGYQKILFLFVDGFGYRHFTDYGGRFSFFKRLAREGTVYPLTSVFPSTTPAALTALHTSLTPQEHGLPEWTVYFDEFERIIEPFPFRPHLSDGRETLIREGGTPEMLFDGITQYEQLKKHGVASYVYTPETYADSAYSRASQKGSTIVPFSDVADLFTKLVDNLTQVSGPAYYFVPWYAVDQSEHIFGPRSEEHLGALAELSDNLERLLLDNLSEEAVKNILFMLSSDHGQTTVHNEDIIYLNSYIELEESYQWTKDSRSILPTGAPHDVFLHIYKPKIAHTLNFLRTMLEGKAEVLTTEEALSRGLFGFNEPSERFKRRIGDVLILPYEGYHVWYKHMPGLEYGGRGIHGGLSQEEMLVPLAIAPLSSLIQRSKS